MVFYLPHDCHEVCYLPHDCQVFEEDDTCQVFEEDTCQFFEEDDKVIARGKWMPRRKAQALAAAAFVLAASLKQSLGSRSTTFSSAKKSLVSRSPTFSSVRKSAALRLACLPSPTVTVPAQPAQFPLPAQSYSYSAFEQWFKTQRWEGRDLALTPSWSWFGISEALNGPHSDWFAGHDMEVVTVVAKHINRFLFMESIMRGGNEESQASLAMHLLILKLLEQDLVSGGRAIRALDVGCGTGWLLQAFALMNKNPGSRISGFDIDIDGVQLAQSLLLQPSAISWPLSPAALGPEQQRQQQQEQEQRQQKQQQQQEQEQQEQEQQRQLPLPLQAPSVFRADLLKPDFGLEAEARKELLPEGSFQVVNLGMAVLGEESEAFVALTRLLAEGGCLTVPVCVGPVCVDGKCSADFRLYRRRGDTLIQEAGGYTVSFIAPLD